MKRILPVALLLACASCKSPSSTADSGPPAPPPVETAELDREAVLNAIIENVDRILRQLPAARDEAQGDVDRLKKMRVSLGDAEVKKRMARFNGTPVPRSALSDQAFNTLVVVNSKWKSSGLEALVSSDAGSLQAAAARRVKDRLQMLKLTIVMLEELDRARFELAILSGVDAGIPVVGKSP